MLAERQSRACSFLTFSLLLSARLRTVHSCARLRMWLRMAVIVPLPSSLVLLYQAASPTCVHVNYTYDTSFLHCYSFCEDALQVYLSLSLHIPLPPCPLPSPFLFPSSLVSNACGKAKLRRFRLRTVAQLRTAAHGCALSLYPFLFHSLVLLCQNIFPTCVCV